jgi:hypothetical protein
MFRAEDIVARMQQEPFRSVRFTSVEGLRYDVHHPDLVLVGERDVMIGTPSRRGPGIYNQVMRLALVHLVGMEDIPAETAPPSNGASHN